MKTAIAMLNLFTTIYNAINCLMIVLKPVVCVLILVHVWNQPGNKLETWIAIGVAYLLIPTTRGHNE